MGGVARTRRFGTGNPPEEELRNWATDEGNIGKARREHVGLAEKRGCPSVRTN